jgi:hypothetical protein
MPKDANDLCYIFSSLLGQEIGVIFVATSATLFDEFNFLLLRYKWISFEIAQLGEFAESGCWNAFKRWRFGVHTS